MIKVSVPGKLYISGEYAVLEAGQPAILVALNRYLTATIEEDARDRPKVHLISRQLGLRDLSFNWQSDWEDILRRIGLLSDSDLQGVSENLLAWQYVISAIQTYQAYYGQPMKNFRLKFETDLVHESGDKIGLGSSGAVVVATLKALHLLHSGLPMTSMDLYKLAAVALFRLNSQGSMGDIAANSFGGWLFYQAFDRPWLREQLEMISQRSSGSQQLRDLLAKDWPSLIIQPLQVPDQIDLLIGWTRSPASTDRLVNTLQEQVPLDRGAYYQQFLGASKQSVLALKVALGAGDFPMIVREIHSYYSLLDQLSQHYQLGILTPDLIKLVEIAQRFGYVAKSSGAGGGDCGIALGLKDKRRAQQISESWQAAGILPLPLKVTYD